MSVAWKKFYQWVNNMRLRIRHVCDGGKMVQLKVNGGEAAKIVSNGVGKGSRSRVH